MIIKKKPLNSGLSLSGLSLSNKEKQPKKILVNKNYKAIKAVLKGGVSLSQEEEGIFYKLLGSSKFYWNFTTAYEINNDDQKIHLIIYDAM